MTQNSGSGELAVRIDFSAQIFAIPEDAMRIQQSLAEFAAGLGGLACSITLNSPANHASGIEEATATAVESSETDFLDINLHEALRRYIHENPGNQDPDAFFTRTSNLLKRENVHTIREILAIGKTNFRKYRNAGQKMQDAIDAAIHTQSQSTEWLQQPKYEDLIVLYPNIFEIPGAAFETDFSGQTLADVLNMSPETLARVQKFNKVYYRKDAANAQMFEGLPEHVEVTLRPDIDRAIAAQKEASVIASGLLAEIAKAQRNENA